MKVQIQWRNTYQKSNIVQYQGWYIRGYLHFSLRLGISSFFGKMWLLFRAFWNGVECELWSLSTSGVLWKQRICSWEKIWYEVNKKLCLRVSAKVPCTTQKISNGDVVGQVLKNLLTSGPLSMSLRWYSMTLRWQCDVWSGWWRPSSVPASSTTTTTTRMGLAAVVFWWSFSQQWCQVEIWDCCSPASWCFRRSGAATGAHHTSAAETKVHPWPGRWA